MDATTLCHTQSFRTQDSSSHHALIKPSDISVTQNVSQLDAANHQKPLNLNSNSPLENKLSNCDTDSKLAPSENGRTAEETEDSGGIDIFINNVVCTFTVRCHLNLKKIGMEGINVEYKREYGKVTMKLRNPSCTATIWSSGKITVTGNDSEENAKKSARRIARRLQKLGFNIRFQKFKVVNVLGTCRMPFAIRISEFSREHRHTASYEPELHPAVTYKLPSPRATLKIFSTGSITVTAPAVSNIQAAIQHIYPLVEKHQMKRIVQEIPKQPKKEVKENVHKRAPPPPAYLDDDEEDEDQFLDDFDSECTDDDDDDEDDL